MGHASQTDETWPRIRTAGFDGFLVSFGERLTEPANRAALAFRDALEAAACPGVEESSSSLVSTYLRVDPLAVSHAEIMQLMFGPHIGPAPVGTDKDAFAVLLTIVESGIAAGVFRARDAGELAQVAWSTMHGLAMLITANRLDVDVSDPAALAERVSSVASNVIYGLSR